VFDKILIVDDSLIARLKLRYMLEKNNLYVAGEAEDGLEAVKKYISLKPELVIMDIIMPKMSGPEALKEIMKINSKAKVIVVASEGQESVAKEMLSEGAITFLTEPFDENLVIDVITRILNVDVHKFIF
jgi:two-component system, chemotaxis family, chemotaxis protein CheY